MSDPYVGRHRRAAAAAGRTPARAGAAFRPIVSTAASIALASVGLGAFVALDAGRAAPSQSARLALLDATFDPDGQTMAVGRHLGTVADVAPAFDAVLADQEIGAANRALTQRVTAVSVANAQAAAAVAAEAARLEQERQAAADRAARDAQRASVTANARQDPKAAARVMAADRGWGESQFQCLVKLWTKESNWRWNADNPTSSAYGIPQALPGSKMASAGSDWRTNPVTQISWGLGYIAARYGTPCAAWNHSVQRNWY
ncbi:MAG: hypothetical protein WAR57_13440 [Candidatus Phosphoribacter sp.]